MKIAYLKHPLSLEKRTEWVRKGFRIVDVKFAPKVTGADDYVEGREKPKKKTEGEKSPKDS